MHILGCLENSMEGDFMKLFNTIKKIMVLVIAGVIVCGDVAMGMQQESETVRKLREKISILQDSIKEVKAVEAIHGKPIEKIRAASRRKKGCSLIDAIKRCFVRHPKTTILVTLVVITGITYYVYYTISSGNTELLAYKRIADQCTYAWNSAQASAGLVKSQLQNTQATLESAQEALEKCLARPTVEVCEAFTGYEEVAFTSNPIKWLFRRQNCISQCATL